MNSPYEPTAAEIVQECSAMQGLWTDTQRSQRLGCKGDPVTVTVAPLPPEFVEYIESQNRIQE
jgi:hypothetical protein